MQIRCPLGIRRHLQTFQALKRAGLGGEVVVSTNSQHLGHPLGAELVVRTHTTAQHWALSVRAVCILTRVQATALQGIVIIPTLQMRKPRHGGVK